MIKALVICVGAMATVIVFVARNQTEANPQESLSAEEECRAEGVVKWFNDEKGFGFIKPKDGSAEVLAHWQQIEGDGFKTLEKGQVVCYVPQKGPKGIRATEIRLKD